MRDVHPLLEIISSRYCGKGKLTWNQLDLDFLEFIDKFFLGENNAKDVKEYIKIIFKTDKMKEYIREHADHKKGSGVINKKWVSCAKKGKISVLFDFTCKDILDEFSIDQRDRATIDIMKIYNMVFVYFLAYLDNNKHGVLYLTRELAFLIYIQNNTNLNEEFSVTNKNFQKYYYENFMDDAIQRTRLEYFGDRFVLSLKKVMPFFFREFNGELSYNSLINKFGLCYLSLERIEEIFFSLNFSRESTFIDEFKQLSIKGSLYNKGVYADLQSQEKILLDNLMKAYKPFVSNLVGVLQEFMQDKKISNEEKIFEETLCLFRDLTMLFLTNNSYFIYLSNEKIVHIDMFLLFNIYRICHNSVDYIFTKNTHEQFKKYLTGSGLSHAVDYPIFYLGASVSPDGCLLWDNNNSYHFLSSEDGSQKLIEISKKIASNTRRSVLNRTCDDTNVNNKSKTMLMKKIDLAGRELIDVIRKLNINLL